MSRVKNTVCLLAILVGAFQSACKSKAPSAESETDTEFDPASAPKVSSQTTKEHMVEHFDRSANLLAAVIEGNLVAAKEHSSWLALHEGPKNLAEWLASIGELRTAAKQGETSDDLAAMSQVTANVAAACGNCHATSKSVPGFALVEHPETGSDANKRMLLHKWAADRMWEGLIGPSDELWSQGVAALAIAPLHDDQILDRASAAPDIVAQAQAVHDLANEGSNATTTEMRAELYGRFLANCASCHARVGGGGSEK